MKHKAVLVLFVFFSFLLTACLDSPEKGAKEWFDAMLNLDGNKLLDRTCLQYRANIQEWGLWNSAFAMLPQLFGVDLRSEGDVSGLEFETIGSSQTETNAYVWVHGEIRVAVLAFAQAYPVDETWQMVKEDGVWRWCGLP
jgi:hypothetical protein